MRKTEMDGPAIDLSGQPAIKAKRAPRGLLLIMVGAALLAGALLAGCGGGSCVDFDGPEFVTDSLPKGTVGQPYKAQITVEIAREPYDDDYNYSFRIDGDVPLGLQVLMPSDERYVELIGTPQSSGTYTFTVFVSVADKYGEDPDLCWYKASRTYTIVVN